MTNANDLAVVELTNTSDRALVVILTLGGVRRPVATLARGASIVLVSPEGSHWSFEPTGVSGADGSEVVGGSPSRQRTADPAGSEPDGADGDGGDEDDDGGRGGKGGHN